MQKWVVICWALLALVGADECPDGGICGDGQTCCNDPASGYECCPFDKAECCGDHVHCCPAETTCDTATSSCVNATVSIPWVERASANQPTHSKSFRMIKTYMGEEDDNICPDQSRCPAEFSCLRALTKFGCCPLTQGVSCSDGKHCCPEGHQCSEDSRSCIKKELVPAILCPDGKSECPDGTTCCENPEGKWGCCPMPMAVCCEDKLHCCPKGTTCDIEHSKCTSSSTKKEMPMWAKLPARIRAEWENQKEGEQAAGETVPEVTTANTVPSTDSEEPVSSVAEAVAGSEPWVTKVPTIPRQSLQSTDVPCDSTASCPDGTTCCKNKAGQWACCPVPKAVCCDDHEHCCPAGTTCDATSSKCINGSDSVPMQQKIPAFVTEAPTTMMTTTNSDVPCNDTAACPDKTTCCKTQEGGWSCCPLPEAVCCEDFIHCCPHGKKCNLAAQTCDDATCSVPWVTKVPTIPRQSLQSTDVPCDSTASCPDGTTCCKNKAGQWACCPLPKAVCCDDHEHCCPAGTTCDATSSKCINGSDSVPMQQKIPAFVTEAPTTMMTTTNSIAVPLTEQMEEENKGPEEGEGMTDGEKEENKEDQENESKDVQDGVQCDPHTRCPQSTTCCFMKSSQKWGCCPLPEAVCCADGSHCCPAHYKCNELETSCIKGEVVIPWYTKLPATTSVQAHSSSVHCDSLNQCPERTTCCRLATGEWGCCPLQNAVCCPDKEHCCPEGYTCNIASNSCQKVIMLQLETVPLTPVYLPMRQSQLTDIQCDEQTSCQTGETCCKTSATTWGCCPMPNAVCCSDMKHCCPTGYTCTDAGKCTQNTRFHWYSRHMLLDKKKRTLLL